MLILDEIIKGHPRSLEALMLQKGRLGATSIDLATLRAASAQWESKNRSLARRIREFEGTSSSVRRTVQSESNVRKSGSVSRDANTVDREALAVDQSLTDFVRNLTPPKNGNGQTSIGNSAQKMTKNQVFQNLRRATVLLYFVVPGRDGRILPVSAGTGFFISPTQILTNAHVEEHGADPRGSWLAINETIGARPVTVTWNAKKHSSVKIDAALMRTIDFENDHFLTLNTTHQLDTWIGIAGYPGIAAESDSRYESLERSLISGQPPEKAIIPTAVVVEGLINNVIPSRYSRATDLQYTAETAPGNSGSPVVNACGEVVGLHYSGTRSRVTEVQGGSAVSAAKYNMAVSVADVSLFLNQVESGVLTQSQECQVAY